MRVFIQAYLEGNLGDDLFVELLLKRYPNINFIVIAPKYYKKTFSKYENLFVVHRGYFLMKSIGYILHKLHRTNFILKMRQKRLIASSSLIVKIGGSLFQENESSHLICQYDEFLLNQKKPIYALGCNFGPYNSEDFLEKYKEIFSSYKDICFRDTYSYNLFKELKPARLHSDIIFSYPYVKEQETKTIGISIMNFNNQKYFEILKSLVENYNKEGYEIILFGFSKFEKDNVAIKKLETILESKNRVKSYIYDGNIELFLREYSKCKYIVASRFHSMILAVLMEKPVYTFVYSKKTLNVLKDLSIEKDSIELDQLSNWKIENVFRTFEEKRESTSLKADASLHFEALDEVLK